MLERPPPAEEQRGFFGTITSAVGDIAEAVEDRIRPGDEVEQVEDSAPTATRESAETSGDPEADGPSLFDRFIGGVEQVAERISDRVEEGQERREAEEAEFIAEASEAYATFQANPDHLNSQLGDEGLGAFTDAELYALAQLSSENEGVGLATQQAVREDVADYDSFGDIPTDRGSQILINQFSGDEQTEHLGNLLEEELISTLDSHLDAQHENGHRGDDQADRAIEALLSDAEELAATHPALAAQLEDRFVGALESTSGELTDVRRNDDRWYQDVGHAVSGAVSWTGGAVGDGLRFAVRGAGEVLDVPQQLVSDAASSPVELQGDVLGVGLDAIGQHGAADGVRGASDAVSDGIQSVSDFSSSVNEDVFIGIGEGLGVAAEGIGVALSNPVGTGLFGSNS